MTLAEVITRARRLARTDTNAAADSILTDMVEDAVRQFSRDVHGFPYEEYLLAKATFDTNTDYRLRLYIVGGTNALATTDVAITATARTDASGDTVAGDLETAVNAAIATGDVSISFKNFYFEFDTTNSTQSTSITVSAPDDEDYLDARDLLGLSGSLDEDSTGTFTGDFPEDCTRRQTLSRTPISIGQVAWDNHPLSQAPADMFVQPQSKGDPGWYYQEGDDIIIMPSPTSQKTLYVRYKGIADASAVSDDATMPTEIPTDYHIALCYWVAAELLIESFEDDLASMRRAKYEDKVREYLVAYNNQNTAMMPRRVQRLWYDYGGRD